MWIKRQLQEMSPKSHTFCTKRPVVWHTDTKVTATGRPGDLLLDAGICVFMCYIKTHVEHPMLDPSHSQLLARIDLMVSGRSSQRCDIFGKYQKRSNDFQVAILAKNHSILPNLAERIEAASFDQIDVQFWKELLWLPIWSSFLDVFPLRFLLHGQNSEVERR